MAETDSKQAQRERIVAAADRLLARRGFRGTTMDDVATEAGIGKGTTYLYFRSKDDLALAVIDAHVRSTFARLCEIADGDATPRKRLERMAIARVLERFDRFRHYGEGLHDMLAAIRPQLLEQRERQLNEEALIFVRPLRALAPSATDSALRRIAGAILTATNSLLPYYLSSRQLGERALIARRTRDLAGIVISGAIVAIRGQKRLTPNRQC
jgi:AcrR family transcriptional regulator